MLPQEPHSAHTLYLTETLTGGRWTFSSIALTEVSQSLKLSTVERFRCQITVLLGHHGARVA